MCQSPHKRRRSWFEKFRVAARGVAIGVRGQNSFLVHTICAAAVIALAALMMLSTWQWCVVLLCVVIVLVAEMFNTSLETLAKSIDSQYHPQLRDALDIASGAVLLAAIGAVTVGSIVFASALLH